MGNAFKYRLKGLIIIQTKAMRLSFKKGYNHPTEELFLNSGIVQLDKLYILAIDS